jgi:hypothetical protein
LFGVASKVFHVVHRRVTDSILAVASTPRNPDFITIPAGSVIETADDFSKPGLHRVTFDGKDLLAFTRDILERTQHIESM